MDSGAKHGIPCCPDRQIYRRIHRSRDQQVRKWGLPCHRKRNRVLSHLDRLRRIEIRLSDTEAFVYGAIFLVLLAFIVFNLWFAAAHLAASVGTIFSIISYSWEFVESALVLPMTLQGWSRLTEIMQRINRQQETA